MNIQEHSSVKLAAMASLRSGTRKDGSTYVQVLCQPTDLDLPPHGARGLLCHAAASAANTKGVDAIDIDACDLGKGDGGAPALRVGGVSRGG